MIEHKFHLSLEDETGIHAAHFQMIVMTITMIIASGFCFVSSFAYAKKERDDERQEKLRAHHTYSQIFGDEKIDLSRSNVGASEM